MKKELYNILRVSFFLSLGCFFIWVFLANLETKEKTEILDSLRKANYWWLLATIILGIISLFFRTMRWKMLLVPLGYKPRIWNVFLSIFISSLANLAIPRLGEVSRCTILTRYEKIPFNKSFGTVLIERGIDFLLFVLLFLANIVIQYAKLNQYFESKINEPLAAKFRSNIGIANFITWLILGIVVASVVLFFVFRESVLPSKFFQKITSMLKGLWEGIYSVTKLRNPWLFIFHSIFIWVLYFLMAWVVFLSLPETAILGLEAGISVLLFGTIGIIIVQGGIGIYPTIVAGTLLVYGIPQTTGYAMGWLIWSAQTTMVIVTGTISLLLLPLFNNLKYENAINISKKLLDK